MKITLFLVSATSIVLAGCNAGAAPETMKPEDVKSAVDKATPEQQIDWYKRSPLPEAEKNKKIAEIKEKAGIK